MTLGPELNLNSYFGDFWYLLQSLGSLSNHDDDGNKNPTNLHIWKWKTAFLHDLHVQSSSFDILLFSFFKLEIREVWRSLG